MALEFLRTLDEDVFDLKNRIRYVYLLIENEISEEIRDDTFYVGRGTGERCFVHPISAYVCSEMDIEMSKKLKRITNSDNLVILKVIEEATMREVKFIESFLINKYEFKDLSNSNKEEAALNLYTLNDLEKIEFVKLLDDEIERAISENRIEIVDKNRTIELINSMNVKYQNKQFTGYSHVESIVGYQLCGYYNATKWSKEQLEYIIELAKINNNGHNYDDDLIMLNEIGNTNYSKSDLKNVIQYQRLKMSIKFINPQADYDWTDMQLNYVLDKVLEYEENYLEYDDLLSELNSMDNERQMDEFMLKRAIEKVRIEFKITACYIFNDNQTNLVRKAVEKAQKTMISNSDSQELLIKVNELASKKRNGEKILMNVNQLRYKVIKIRKQLNLQLKYNYTKDQEKRIKSVVQLYGANRIPNLEALRLELMEMNLDCVEIMSILGLKKKLGTERKASNLKVEYRYNQRQDELLLAYVKAKGPRASKEKLDKLLEDLLAAEDDTTNSNKQLKRRNVINKCNKLKTQLKL